MALLITCREASELVAKRSVERLNFTEWIHLKVHVSICAMCKIMAMQMEVVRKGAEMLGKQPPPVDVPDGMSDRIADRLKNEDGFPKAS